jgi:GxxExxY protein
LGPGFQESIYEHALRIELRHSRIPFRFQEDVPVMYRGEQAGLQRFDLLVVGRMIVELKAVKALEDIPFAQVRSSLP